ncbi:MAG: WxcM-like domain-containing protein [Bacteroidetes bacterium]|nr:WxcM-like domain-containing protein [Bacteroidota bacterium]
MGKAEENTVFDCHIVDLPKIENPAGNITPLNSGIDLPFNIERVYYLYDVPGGESRGGHGHRELNQYLVAASGSFDVVLKDGTNERTISLNRPYSGIHIVPGIWRELTNFSSGSVCLVVASQVYTQSDYIRDYKEFLNYKE